MRFQKEPIVRDDQKGLVRSLQIVLEPFDRSDVQVVGRLVQKQKIDVGEQQFGKRQTVFSLPLTAPGPIGQTAPA